MQHWTVPVCFKTAVQAAVRAGERDTKQTVAVPQCGFLYRECGCEGLLPQRVHEGRAEAIVAHAETS